MTFKDKYLEFQEIVKEVEYVRRHNFSFEKYDPRMLLMAEGALVLLAFERFMRMILGDESRSDDTLKNLLDKATSQRLDLIKLPGRMTRDETITIVVKIRNVLAHANYEQAALESGLRHKDDYFKTGVYLSQVETLYRIVNRIIKQIDRDTGKPHDRANPDIRDFLASPAFLDLSRPAEDEKPAFSGITGNAEHRGPET
jgi:hypothetical protein